MKSGPAVPRSLSARLVPMTTWNWVRSMSGGTAQFGGMGGTAPAAPAGAAIATGTTMTDRPSSIRAARMGFLPGSDPRLGSRGPRRLGSATPWDNRRDPPGPPVGQVTSGDSAPRPRRR